MEQLSADVDRFEQLFTLAASLFVAGLLFAAVAAVLWLIWRRATQRSRAARRRRERLETFAFLRVD